MNNINKAEKVYKFMCNRGIVDLEKLIHAICEKHQVCFDWDEQEFYKMNNRIEWMPGNPGGYEADRDL